ncbi:uncharacterized protein si:dkey-96g2.1 isoform X2 [Boleophthalmus pectinirostris]|nr:uncharacterized protein si:dkey-96g2.1 isoform X2 [Boleophthalmus pectinirostris]
MASLLWTVLLSTLLWAQTCKAVDETELGGLVANLLNVYRPTYQVHGDTPTFTLAVSIPYNPATRSYDLSQVTAVDDGQTVRNSLDNCEVYVGNRVIGAMVRKWPDVIQQCPNAVVPTEWSFLSDVCPNFPLGLGTWDNLREECTNSINKKIAKSPNGAVDHAEYRVLQSFNHFVNMLNNGQLNRNDLMLFYSYKSPCDSRCASLTNHFSIVQSITGINSWANHALVFSNIFVPTKTKFTPEQLEANRRTALTNLGNAIQGVGNIYRCRVGANRCTSCEVPTGVSNTCVSDNTRSRSTSPTGK